METKKSKTADLERRKTSMFFLGVIVATAIILESFEWVTPNYFKRDYISSDMEELPDEIVEEFKEVQQVKQNIVKTTSKADVVTVIDDDTKLVEKVIKVEKKEEQLWDISEDDLITGDEGEDGGFFIDDDDIIYDASSLDINPQFPGGPSEMMSYLSKNTIYPKISLENISQGKAYVSFLVDKKGNITDVNILKSTADKYCNKEAVRVVKNMPQWEPGEVRGRKVTARFILPINFIINQ